MKRLIITTLLLAATSMVMAQESHYHRSLRSQDTNYGLVVDAPLSGNGMFWSRTRDANDTEILNETPADSIARREDFKRLCRLAYDAYDAGDALHTVVYGDSALQKRYHTPDLYFFMAVSLEKLNDYKSAEWAYKKALSAGYVPATRAYAQFKERQKQRKAEEKQKRKKKERK